MMHHLQEKKSSKNNRSLYMLLVTISMVLFCGYCNAQTEINGYSLSDSTIAFNRKVNGKKQQWWKRDFFFSGYAKKVCYYKDGKKNGEYLLFYNNGRLKEKGKYLNNKKEGAICYYRKHAFPDSLHKCFQFSNGKKNEELKINLPD